MRDLWPHQIDGIAMLRQSLSTGHRRPMLQAERDIKKWEAVGEVGGAVQRVDIPAICPVQSGANSLFAKNTVLGKLLAQPLYDKFFRGPVGFGNQVDIAFILRGHAALEVSAKQFARF